MVGITLSPEQIRAAPPDVRQWLEHEIAATLGLAPAQAPAAPPEAARDHLVALDPAAAAALYESIGAALPLATVFFDLGGEGLPTADGALVAFRLADLARHARLDSVEALLAALDALTTALRRISGDDHAALVLLDRRGYCLVPTQTRTSIGALWRRLVSGATGNTAAPDAAFPVRSPTMPAASHFDGGLPPGFAGPSA
ncbi:hypothetical protein [Prosthecomicrobium pneumaticum]|uniref:Uncharacterized protein n=1 Tax=Prosthecomicrobium pneumaticum TaxID=81895 RepID=A0A7W9FLJ8_9HYPH|nr:hypothetical protein [Prosthecomicrobium pneumaticum]MBB5752914.1 hypothetical protein [Prosthecomicrobium pneumaticum]